MPFGLRRPLANTRCCPLAMSISQIAARPASTSIPRSATLLLEPTVAYSLLPSGLAMRPLVQWWLSVPPGRSTSLVGVAVMRVSPFLYGNHTTASVFAT
jgi:hypothetical protein